MDGTEERDPQGRAELVGGLGYRRRRSGAFCGHRPDDGVGVEGHRQSDAETHQREGDDDPCQPRRGFGKSQDHQADAAQPQPGADRTTGPEFADRDPRERDHHDRGRCSRELQQPGLERAESAHELKVLGEEEQQPDEGEDGHGVGGHGRGEGAVPEQGDVDQRGGEGALPAQEPPARRQPEGEGGHRGDGETGGENLLDGLHQRDDGHHRQHRRQQVDPSLPGVARLRQQPQPARDHRDHDGNVDEEDAAPREVLQERPTDDRPDGGPGRRARRPDCDGPRPLLPVGKHRTDEGQRRRHDRRAADPQQGPGRDQQLGGGGERRQQRRQPEPDRTDHQEAFAADAVGEVAHHHEQARQGERVDVAYPQDLRRARRQVGGQGGDGQGQHGAVDCQQHDGQGEDAEGSPGTAGSGARTVGIGHIHTLPTKWSVINSRVPE